MKVFTVVAFDEPRVLATFQRKEDADIVASALYRFSGLPCSVAEDTYNDETGYVFRTKSEATKAIVGLLALLDLQKAQQPAADDTSHVPGAVAPRTHRDP